MNVLKAKRKQHLTHFRRTNPPVTHNNRLLFRIDVQFKLYPLSRAEKWQMTIEMDVDPEKKTIVMCHGGIRSAKVCQMLLSLGFEDVHNVVGGIDAYSSIDKSVPRY
jgi:rhodanese-related sulfurtransferase